MPVLAPLGTLARPTMPLSRCTSASTVGLPRLSSTSRAWTLTILGISFHRQGPQREPCNGARDLVHGRGVAEFINLVASKVLKIVELADMHPLLNQQVLVDGNERVASRRCRIDF